MKKLVIIMTVIGMGLTACNSGEHKGSNVDAEAKQVFAIAETKVDGNEHTFTFEKETITIQASEDGKTILNGTYQADGGSAQAITFINMEVSDEGGEGAFFSDATCPAWKESMMIGIMSDFSAFSLIGQEEIKKFTRK